MYMKGMIRKVVQGLTHINFIMLILLFMNLRPIRQSILLIFILLE